MFVANYRFHLKILTRVRALIVGPECRSGADIGHAEEYPIRSVLDRSFPVTRVADDFSNWRNCTHGCERLAATSAPFTPDLVRARSTCPDNPIAPGDNSRPGVPCGARAGTQVRLERPVPNDARRLTTRRAKPYEQVTRNRQCRSTLDLVKRKKPTRQKSGGLPCICAHAAQFTCTTPGLPIAKYCRRNVG